jgi:hypothetical protein
MPAYYDVFAKPLDPEANFLDDVSHILGSTPEENPGGNGYGINTERATIDVFLEHDLVDDGQLLFTQYPYYLTVRDWDRDRQRAEQLAKSLYEGLQATGRYKCMIVWNDMVLIEPNG